jgi:hypothetical protein
MRTTINRLLPARMRGAFYYPPGHFHSPLIDPTVATDDGEAYWEAVDMNHARQVATYKAMTAIPVCWPASHQPPLRYFLNGMFSGGDATVLNGMIRLHRPQRIIEVGSGYSTAAMLDTMDSEGYRAELTCIEPYPSRLKRLLRANDRVDLRECPVEKLPITTFDDLGKNDVLFIDSSHVAKIGSDVTYLFLRVLPRLKAGVIVHVHDIFWPHSYPRSWIDMGWAWNESLILRALLIGGGWNIEAFNSYAARRIAEHYSPDPDSVGSIWLRKL